MCEKGKKSKVIFVKIQRWIDKFKFWWLSNLIQKNKPDTILEKLWIYNEYHLI